MLAKGVNAAVRSQDHLPGKIYMKFEQLDGDGKAKSRNELWLEWRREKRRPGW